MRVVEIFKSIDGEGIRAGLPATFIRLEGCNLRCNYCDTQYSYTNADFKEMIAEEVVIEVFRLGCKRVTITGGEPLIHKGIEDLLWQLIYEGFELNIETNGSIDLLRFINGFGDKDLLFTMDYKCPSSGMEDKMFISNLGNLRKKDVIKFVVSGTADLDRCRDLIKFTDAQVFISPVFGRIEPSQIVDYMLEHNMSDCRVQLQLHKYIWNPDKRGV